MFNFYIYNNAFPSGLKKDDIKLVYKKDDPSEKNNYRPISILPISSKAFERCLYDQVFGYVDNMLSKAQCSFRK